MKRASLLAACAIVLVANLLALLHAWENRRRVDADVVLTERELGQRFNAELGLVYNPDKEDSGIGLTLRWTDARMGGIQGGRVQWPDTNTLLELGFDTTVAPGDPAAMRFYQRQRSRRAFVALEHNGPAWLRWQEWLGRQEQHAIPEGMADGIRRERESISHLVLIDVGPSADRLRRKHPDRSSVIIVPAAIAIGVQSFSWISGAARPAPMLEGTIEEIPTSIHLPLAFSEGFRNLARNGTAKYRVHLRYGASLEPWIVGVEFTPSAQ